MRLGTLARKIRRTPTKLSQFLEDQGVDLIRGTNTKLSDEQIELALEHFDVTLEKDVTVEEETTDEVIVNKDGPIQEIFEKEKKTRNLDERKVESTLEEEQSNNKETIEEENEVFKEVEDLDEISDSFAEMALPHELNQPKPDEIEEPALEEEIEKEPEQNIKKEPEPEPDQQSSIVLDPSIESAAERSAHDSRIKVIKPPKVKLQGLTVKGKIDLPEPKPKEVKNEPKIEEKPYDPNEIITTQGPKKERRKKPKNYKGKKYDKEYNPVESARRKKIWEEGKKMELATRKKKKAKSKHYKSNIVPVTQATPGKKKVKKAPIPKKEEKIKGNVFQKFWRWMNT